MAHALRVAVLHAVHKLAEIEAGLILGEAACRHDLVEELTARHELEHDEDLGARRKHLVVTVVVVTVVLVVVVVVSVVVVAAAAAVVVMVAAVVVVVVAAVVVVVMVMGFCKGRVESRA